MRVCVCVYVAFVCASKFEQCPDEIIRSVVWYIERGERLFQVVVHRPSFRSVPLYAVLT